MPAIYKRGQLRWIEPTRAPRKTELWVVPDLDREPDFAGMGRHYWYRKGNETLRVFKARVVAEATALRLHHVVLSLRFSPVPRDQPEPPEAA